MKFDVDDTPLAPLVDGVAAGAGSVRLVRHGRVVALLVPATEVPRDPVHRKGGGWWFWHEDWAGRSGPYSDQATARAALAEYAEAL